MTKKQEKNSLDTQLDLFAEQERLEAEEVARLEKESKEKIESEKEQKEEDDDFIEPYSPREEYYTRFDRFR